MKEKQIIYAKNRIIIAENKLRLKFMISIMALFAMMLVADCITTPSPDKIDAIGLFGTGFSLAVMSAVGNITYLSDRETSPNQIAYKVWLIDVHQVDPDETYPSPNGSGEVSTIPLLTGEYWHYFEAIDNTLEDKTTGAKGEVTTDVTNTFAFIMGGNPTALMTFIRDHAGGKFIIVYKDVSDSAYRILGSIDKPMVLQNYERKNDKEGKYIPFTFQNKWFDMQWIYVGNLTTTSPVEVPEDATDLAITSNPTYQLTDGSVSSVTIATVSGLASADIGRIIDVLGSGGTYPSDIEDNSVFVLSDAGTWSANAGSRISFKILGTSCLVEVLGSRVQTA